MNKSRLESFEEIVQSSPTDSFAHYALALEYEKVGRADEAINTFRKLLGFNPDYVPAYQMCGQLLMRLERFEEARRILSQGLEKAQQTDNAKARDEIQGLLEELAKLG
ncbi:MAG: tetratricopeptide repeat protein [Acidobacteriia bacterium]|nr:tetratricopeptide repeat protein [Terriglobia bacterium]